MAIGCRAYLLDTVKATQVLVIINNFNSEYYMHKTSKDFLFKYLNNTSPTGYETAGQKIWLDYLRPYIDDHFTDTYGTAVGVINPEATYKVVIEAHADEISWFVNYISKEGYIYVIRNGGSDYQFGYMISGVRLSGRDVYCSAIQS